VQASGEPVEGTSPPSYPEERFFRLDKSPVPIAQTVVIEGTLMAGELDPAALETAVGRMVERHDVFRSRFEEFPEGLRKVVSATAPSPFQYEDLSSLGEPRASEALRERIGVLTRWSPKATADPPLLRVELYRLGTSRHALVFAVHHIIFDGGSMALFWADLAACYQAAVERRPVALPPPTPYVEFAKWQRRLYAGPAREEGETYWRQRLAGATPLNRALWGDRMAGVDTLRERSPIAPVPTSGVVARVPPGIGNGLRQLARQGRTPLFNVFYGALAVALGRTAGITDVTFSSLFNMRMRVAGLERTIGFLTNASLLRLDLSGNPTFSEVVARSSADHRDLLRTPEFQVVPLLYPHINDFFRIHLNFQQGGAAFTWPGFELSPLPSEGPVAPEDGVSFQDLGVRFDPDPTGGFEIVAGYNSLLWSRPEAQGLVERCATLLRRAAEDPSARFEQL
jgi:hypothetical protein